MKHVRDGFDRLATGPYQSIGRARLRYLQSRSYCLAHRTRWDVKGRRLETVHDGLAVAVGAVHVQTTDSHGTSRCYTVVTSSLEAVRALSQRDSEA